MIIDTSVIMAILLDEPEAEPFAALMDGSKKCQMSAGSSIELTAVLVRRQPNVSIDKLDALLRRLRIEIVPVTVEQGQIGREAYRRFGVGTGHKAHLNFGNCFAYALAKATGEPLLFKGDDFTHTDIVAAA